MLLVHFFHPSDTREGKKHFVQKCSPVLRHIVNQLVEPISDEVKLPAKLADREFLNDAGRIDYILEVYSPKSSEQ